MRLQARLTLAYLAVTALFLLSFGLSWWVMGGSELMSLMQRPLEKLGTRLANNTLKAYQEGGWPRAEQGLRWALIPSRASLTLYRDGLELPMQGAKPTPDPRLLELAQAGQWQPFSRPEGGADLYVPVETSPRAVLFIRLPAWGVDAHRGLLAASLTRAAIFSVLVAIILALAASSLIAVPVRRLVRATQDLAESDFHNPIQVGHEGELSELAVSFNSMATRLKETVNSLRLAKERAERSEASRRQFMAEASHNLRTPLSAVQGWTEALIDGLVPGEETVHLRKIHRETLFVAQTVQRLLDWSRWEDAPPILKLETLAVSEPLLDSAETLAEAAESKDIKLNFHGLQSEPRAVADRHRLREVFQILLENAVHHNPPGTIIDVAFSQSPLGDRCCISVADDGAGLPQEFRQDLRCRCGGGLGLAIASRLIEAHGGTLELLPESGTRLVFSLQAAGPT